MRSQNEAQEGVGSPESARAAQSARCVSPRHTQLAAIHRGQLSALTFLCVSFWGVKTHVAMPSYGGTVDEFAASRRGSRLRAARREEDNNNADVPLCMGEFVDGDGRVQHICDLCSDNNICRALRKRWCMCPLPGGAKPLSLGLAGAVVVFAAATAGAMAAGAHSRWLALPPVWLAWAAMVVGGLTLPRRQTNPCPELVPPSTTLFVNWIFVCLFAFMLAFTRVRRVGRCWFARRGGTHEPSFGLNRRVSGRASASPRTRGAAPYLTK